MLICILNGKGWAIFQSFNQEFKIPLDKEYCLSGELSIFSVVVNQFVTTLLPIMVQRMKDMQLETHFLGVEEEQIKFVLFVLKELSEWLFQKYFLSYKLEIDIKISIN